MSSANEWIQQTLSQKLNADAANLLAHFPAPDEDGYADLAAFIQAYTTANLPIDAPLSWVFLCRAFCAMVDSGTVPHRKFNGLAESELATLRAVARRPLPGDAEAELAQLDRLIEKVDASIATDEKAPKPLTTAQREAKTDADLIDEYRNRYTTELRDSIKRDPVKRARFERLSSAGVL